MYLLAARDGDFALLMQRFDAGLIVMAIIALLITRRVIPFFAMRVVPGLKLPMQTRTGQLQLGVCGVAVICLLAGLRLPAAIALGVAGLLSLLQLARWKPHAVRGHPLLWILYVGHAGLGVGLLMAACALAGVALPPALPVHMIAMAGFSVLIIGMVTRTALGHLGRPLAHRSQHARELRADARGRGAAPGRDRAFGLQPGGAAPVGGGVDRCARALPLALRAAADPAARMKTRSDDLTIRSPRCA